MASIVVIVHQYDTFPEFGMWSWRQKSKYMLYDVLLQLKRRGHRIEVMRGPGRELPKGDVAIMHVDATVIPAEYVTYAKAFPFCINLAVTDISKKRMSGALVKQGDDWSGPVIVKSNLNYRGVPEMRKNDIAKTRNEILPFPTARATAGYDIYESLSDVPEEAFNDAGLVVEKFIPERDGSNYAARFWVFCGETERCTRYTSPDKLLKGSTVVQHCPVEVPEELRALRKKLGFDYGKFDFVVNDGRAILLDANKTLGRPSHLGQALESEIIRFADGLEGLIKPYGAMRA